MRKVRARGVTETLLRRQLAGVATPRVRRFVFVRRVRLRAAPAQIGRAMEGALAKLAEETRQEFLSFADLPALVVACARAAAGGGLTAWHWRTLGLPRTGTAGEAVAALLSEHPLEAGSAVAALAEQGLLAAVWRTMPEPVAARMLSSLAFAMGFSVPAWPDAAEVQPLRNPPASVTALLEQARATWAQTLRTVPPRSEAVRAAAVLALLRWSPRVLRSGDERIWQALLTSITHAARPDSPQDVGNPEAPQHPSVDKAIVTKTAEPDRVAVAGRPDPAVDREPATASAPNALVLEHGEIVSTAWGGVLFLVNALRRLHIEALLDRAGADAPTGWRLLHDLGVAFGMPDDDPLAEFFTAQDLDTSVAPDLLAILLGDIEAVYQPDGPWPLPLVQPARLRATETHLDLDLHAADIDPALRLSGLDLDPGWVPWLGRVVTFHYDNLPTIFHRSG
jgi:hypothetical protein